MTVRLPPSGGRPDRGTPTSRAQGPAGGGPGEDPDVRYAPRVGALLRAAREERGIDLFRAERDTKIRARHLAALEDGDDANLPGAVYARGFLRNYATYLGLDPDELAIRWRAERDHAPADDGTMVVPPQPIADPHRAFTFTPGVIVGLVLALIVVLFAAYVGLQLVRFSQVPPIGLDGPQVVEMQPDAVTVILRGSAARRAVVNVRGVTGELLTTTTADDRGRWLVELGVGKGRNDFTLFARDPETGRDSAELPVVVTVPVPGITGPSPEPGVADGRSRTGVGQVRLEIVRPGDKATFENDVVPVEGTTDAVRVAVTVEWLAQAGGGTPGLLADVPDQPPAFELPVREGAFSGILPLPAGRWRLTFSVAGAGPLAGGTLERVVDVRLGGVVAVIAADGADATVAVDGDGETIEPSLTLRDGEQAVFRARREILIRTSDAAATILTLNGVEIGALGIDAGPVAVILEKGKPPRPAE